MHSKTDDSSPSAATRTSMRSSWDENDGSSPVSASASASGCDSMMTSSTASLQPPQQPEERLNTMRRPGPGLLLFPGTAQRNLHNSAGKTIAKANDDIAGINQQAPRRSIRRFRRPPLWQAPPKDQRMDGGDWKGEEHIPAHPDMPKDRLGACHAKMQAFIIEFLQGSSIHGFIYLAKLGLSLVERYLFNFICIVYSFIIYTTKYQTLFCNSDISNIIIFKLSRQLNMCTYSYLLQPIHPLCSTHPEQFESEEDQDDFRDFIVKLASLTYDNLETLPLNKSFGISSAKYLDLLYELKWPFEPEISSGAAVKMFIYETQTEFGICHSVNSLVARYNSFDYWRSGDWSIMDHGDRVTVHPLDGEIYAQIINLSTAYDVYFHGAGDVPSISKQRYTFPESDYTTVELIALEIYTNEEARAFNTKQRSCRFNYEAEDMLTVPIYSFGLCLSECRMFFALRVCGCIPHFYRNRCGYNHIFGTHRLPVCGLEGIGCLVKIKREIISLKSDRYKINCNCLANCDDSNFFVQSYRSRVWFLGANLQWGIIDYPKMQLRRDVLFSFADVLVYIGGLVGFFLGCSALSFTEIIYYFTARFVRRMFFN
ncbi:hypothetical protein KR009_000887 [Drosophila setifemur]|nr:hypothetical protein KR009_000887 [Drosophila setifemur]